MQIQINRQSGVSRNPPETKVFLLHWIFSLRKLKARIALNGTLMTELPYGSSPAIWDHTVLPATRHKWTRPALTPTRRRLLDLPSPEAALGYPAMEQLGVELVTYRSQVLRHTPRSHIYRIANCICTQSWMWNCLTRNCVNSTCTSLTETVGLFTCSALIDKLNVQ